MTRILFFSFLLVLISAQTCDPGYYYDDILIGCVLCSDALPNCDSCVNSTACTVCMSGFTLNGVDCVPSNATELCDMGSYKDPNTGQCVKCVTTLPNCDYCENGTMCLICVTGYMAQDDGTCKILPNTSCDPGMYYDQLNETCINCSLVIENCTSCLNSTECETCVPGNELNNGACKLLSNATCEANQYPDPELQICMNCSDAIANCTECTNDTLCTLCAQGTVLVNGTCGPPQDVCLLGTFYDPTLATCLNCSDFLENCTQCNDANTCMNCTEPFVLMDGKCTTPPARRLRKLKDKKAKQPGRTEVTVIITSTSYYCDTCGRCDRGNCWSSSCKEGYYYRKGKCYRCPSNCRQCTYSGYRTVCLDCYDGWILDMGKCFNCYDYFDHCSKCYNTDRCNSCDKGYYWNGRKCISCSSSMPGCSSCYDGSTCIECYYPLRINVKTGRCSCSLTNCDECSSDYTECRRCSPGCYLDGGRCYSCHPTCASCVQYGANCCTSCPDNSYFNKAKGVSTGYCKCYDGYDFDWQMGKCVSACNTC